MRRVQKSNELAPLSSNLGSLFYGDIPIIKMTRIDIGQYINFELRIICMFKNTHQFSHMSNRLIETVLLSSHNICFRSFLSQES